MNNKNRKIITVLLAAAMTLSTAGAVSAATTDDQSGAVRIAQTTGAEKTAATTKASTVTLNNGNAIPSGSNLGSYHSIKPNVGYAYNTGSYSSSYYVIVPIKPSHTGLLSVSNYGYGRLLNSSKKPVSDKLYVNPNSSTSSLKNILYGVKAGRKYYYKVYGNGLYSSTYGVYANAFAYTNSSYNTTKFGTSSSRARKLKTGSSHKYKGTILSNGSSKYFKYTKKGKKAAVYVLVSTDEKVKVTFTYRYHGKKYTRSKTANRGSTKVYLKTSVVGSGSATVTYNVKVNPLGNSSCVFKTYCK
jgi:hypothetical protein